MTKREPVKLKDVASRAGVSLTTASMALSNTGRVSDETRKKVKKTARQLGYSANRPAQNLRRSRKGAIGLYIAQENRARPYYMEFAFGVVSSAQERNQLVVLFAPPQNETTSHRVPTEVDGYILIDATADDPYVEEILSSGKPVVTAEHPPRIFSAPAGIVTADHRKTLGKLLTHLEQQGTEHPLLLLPSDSSEWARTLRLEYEEWCIRTSKPLRIQHVPFAPTTEEIQHIVEEILQSGQPTDSLIIAPDDVAVGALSAIMAQGLQPRRDILIASCVDSTAMAMSTPPITAIDLAPHAMGRECAVLLQDILDNSLRPSEQIDSFPLVREYPIQLQLRASTQRPDA